MKQPHTYTPSCPWVACVPSAKAPQPHPGGGQPHKYTINTQQSQYQYTPYSRQPAPTGFQVNPFKGYNPDFELTLKKPLTRILG